MASKIAANSAQDAFIANLTSFDLTEREARCYYLLLQGGPMTVSSLAKGLGIDNEGVYRALGVLLEEDMVRASLQSPTRYVAVELSTALKTVMQHRTSQLQQMEARKGDLKEFCQQHPLYPSVDTSSFKVLRNIREIAGIALSTLLSTEEEFLWIAPQEGLQLASTFGVNVLVHELYERGGCTRGITDITASVIPLVQEIIDIGEEVRHFDGYLGVYYSVFDRRHCISAINIDVAQLTPETPASMLYANDLAYARHLLSLFELLWKQSMPAAERINQLLEQGTPEGRV